MLSHMMIERDRKEQISLLLKIYLLNSQLLARNKMYEGYRLNNRYNIDFDMKNELLRLDHRENNGARFK